MIHVTLQRCRLIMRVSLANRLRCQQSRFNRGANAFTAARISQPCRIADQQNAMIDQLRPAIILQAISMATKRLRDSCFLARGQCSNNSFYARTNRTLESPDKNKVPALPPRLGNGAVVPGSWQILLLVPESTVFPWTWSD